MKKLKLLLLVFLLCSYNAAFAGEIDYFQVDLGSDSAKTGEALDLTVTAMDKDNNIVDDYLGTILVFSETDPKAELPSLLNEGSYTFTLSDSGIIKFENAVVFNSEGKHDLHVYDLNDDTDSVAGIAEIDITKGGTEAPQAVDITITSPEPFSTLTTSDVQVAGNTVKNHRVIVTANGNDFETISNDDGIFELTIPNQRDGDILIEAKVVNADEETIGEATAVNLKLSASEPIILGISTTPKEGVPNFGYRVELVSESGLQKVELEINDSITLLTETDSGTYVGDFVAPNDLGEHAISVVLQNTLGVKSTFLNTASITVIPPEPEPESEPELESAEEEPIIESAPVVLETPKEKPNLNVSGLKLTKLKTKSILEWNEVADADSYNLYIKEGGDLLFVENVDDPRATIYITGDKITYNDFIVRAVKEEYENNGDLEGDLSDAISIQTGPEKYILLLFITLLLSTLIFSKKLRLRK